MSCCGKRRAAARRPVAVERGHPASPAPPPRVDDMPERTSGVAVEYRGGTTAVYRSTDSGRLYSFSPRRRIRHLPRSDAQLLLRSPLFRLGARQE